MPTPFFATIKPAGYAQFPDLVVIVPLPGFSPGSPPPRPTPGPLPPYVDNTLPDVNSDEILAVHVRMHKAEGELFRDVLVAGTRACDLRITTLPDKSALDAAAKMLGVSRERLDAGLARVGKSAGPPWGKDQKEAAAAALAALGQA